MAMICIKGTKECTGCMCCREDYEPETDFKKEYGCYWEDDEDEE